MTGRHKADAALVLRLYERLLKRFGRQRWWPADTAWEMMVGAILTQNTSWTNVDKALTELKKARALSIRAIATMPRRRLEKLIRSSGYFRQKARRLQAFARFLKKDKQTREALMGRSKTPWEPLRDRLLAQHGIGPETADSMLLYAGGYPVFVVDAYTRRLGQRMGLFRTDDYHDVQRFFEQRLKPDAPLYNEMHALIVRQAKEICTSRNPKCAECVLVDLCHHGMKQR